ncbi:glutathione S-transferase N-terminal domain-containing protein [bacterium]|nr:glutathione S-transferase N-terminal domain-containing protein [bacterium]
MIELYQYPRLLGVPNMSPPCMKVEGYLKLSGAPHRVCAVHNPSSSPSGRLPYIVDGSTQLAESAVILQYLERQYGAEIDAHLSREQKVLGHALLRMCDGHLYWVGLYSRWYDSSGWEITEREVFGALSPLKRRFLGWMVRRQMKQRCNHQGFGLQPQERVYELGIADLQCLSQALESADPYLFGAEISSYDVGLYAYIANMLVAPYNNPLAEYAHSQEPLTRYRATLEQWWNKSSAG